MVPNRHRPLMRTSLTASALPASFPGAVRRLDPPLTRDVVALLATRPADPLLRRFDVDVRRRGVPVPRPIAAQLAVRGQ